MIISHKHKIIFVKTLKTAGTSIEIGLSKFCGTKDIITRLSPSDEYKRFEYGYKTAQNFIIPLKSYNVSHWCYLLKNRKRVKYYNHIPPSEIKEYLGPMHWDKYFTFCVERNPWDKVVSYYFWTKAFTRYNSIKSFLQSREIERIQNKYFYLQGEKLLVDKLFDFDSLNKLEEELSLRMNVDFSLPTYKAKENKAKPNYHYSHILSDDEALMISRIFQTEIELMNYTFTDET